MAALPFAASGCGDTGEHEAAADAAPVAVVDSVVPMDVAFERFRQGLARPSSLHSTITDRDTLVSRVIDALESSDTMAFEAMALDRAEFAWLYYPYATLARPPYELPPGLAWMQTRESNRKGVLRALRELGGRKLDFRGYRCDPEPGIEGDNRLWTGCVVTIAADGGEPQELRLFGTIIERGGLYEFISYANDF